MPNDDKPNPSPLEDVREGLGLLFRAARNVAKKLPTDPVEKVVLDGAREVGRAVENVATTLEKTIFGAPASKSETAEPPRAADGPAEPPKPAEKPGDDEPRGPRVA